MPPGPAGDPTELIDDTAGSGDTDITWSADKLTTDLGGKAAQTELAPAYSALSTYAVGDYCTYDDGFYVCTTAISAAEAWTAAHWTAVTVGSELIKASSDSIVPMFTNGQSFGSLTCNMTFAEVSAAVRAKKCTSCLCGIVDNVLGFYLFNADSSKIVFATTIDISAMGIPSAMNGLASYYITYNSDGTATLGTGGVSLESIAKDYSSLTYPVAAGTLCLYQSELYKAKQDIPTQEQWTSLHWQVTTVDEQLGLLQTNIDGKADKTDTVLNTTLSHGRKANTTVGEHSVAYGSDVEASEFASHAEGLMTKASGTGAHAEGISTVASGAYAHAEGLSTKATGRFAHSEGWGAKAYGGQSHAEGRSTEASGESSHAEGVRAVADGIAMHASGIRPAPSHSYHEWTAGTQYEVGDCVRYNYYGNFNGYKCKIANADNTFDLTKWEEMINTGTSLYDLWQSGTSYEVGDRVRYLYDAYPPESNGIECVIANSDVEFDIHKWKMLPSDGDTAFVIGNGIHSGLMFDTEEVSNALKVDWDGNIMLAGDVYVHADYDSRNGVKLATDEELAAKADKSDTILDTTLSRGRKANTAVGTASFAFGEYVTASGSNSSATGIHTVASGENSHAEGSASQATGNSAHAEGVRNTNLDSRSITVNGSTYTLYYAAAGVSSHAEGSNTDAYGTASHAEGNLTIAFGDNSHAEGSSANATGSSSHAEGFGTTASGSLSHAEGGGTTASGALSHAEGANTTASAPQSHAEGANTTAGGNQSHAEGASTMAAGAQSHSEGTATVAQRLSQHVFGEYNVAEEGNASSRGEYIEIVGNGSYSNRSNARTLTWTGDERLAGNVYVGCNDDSTGGTRLPHDVKVAGTSVVSGGVANIPLAGSTNPGVVKIPDMSSTNSGILINNNGEITTYTAASSVIKAGSNQYRPIAPYYQHTAVFYGLAKAAGEDMASSDNAVGTYTAAAKTAIQSMLGVEPGVSFVETVSGTTPTIPGEANVRYICGEVSTLSITPPSAGTIVVRFVSGSTATVLTLPGTVIFPAGVDLTTLDANTVYEIMITDGVYGGVMTWAVSA